MASLAPVVNVAEVGVLVALRALLEEAARRLARWRNLEQGRTGGPSLGVQRLDARVNALAEAYDVARDAVAGVLADGADSFPTSYEIAVDAEMAAAGDEELATRLAAQLGIEPLGLMLALEHAGLELVERVPEPGAGSVQ